MCVNVEKGTEKRGEHTRYTDNPRKIGEKTHQRKIQGKHTHTHTHTQTQTPHTHSQRDGRKNTKERYNTDTDTRIKSYQEKSTNRAEEPPHSCRPDTEHILMIAHIRTRTH